MRARRLEEPGARRLEEPESKEAENLCLERVGSKRPKADEARGA